MTPDSGAVALSLVEVAIAASLVLVAGAVSLALRLGLAKSIAIATARAVIQLLLVGMVLSWVFSLAHAAAVFAVLGVMAIAAGRASVRRAERTFSGAGWQSTLTLLISGLVTTTVGTAVLLDVDPFWRPQYIIPMFGMLLGNSLTGISLTLDSLLRAFDAEAPTLEAALALGATRSEAARPAIAEAVRRGMVPILNTMTVVGLVSLPGMMTGQILEGADPQQAVRYQLLILFMICACTAAGCAGIALLAARALFDADHRLRRERIRPWTSKSSSS